MTLDDDGIRRAMAAAADLMRDDPYRAAHVEARARRTAVRRRTLAASGATAVLAAGGLSVRVLAPTFEALSPLGSAGIPDVAVVRCDGTSARALTRTVRPRLDGVHLEVRNTADRTLELLYPGGTVAVPPGESRHAVADAPRGTMRVDCFDATASPEHDLATATITVRDPDGHHKPVPRACAQAPVAAPERSPDPQLPDVQERAVWGADAEIQNLRYLYANSRTVLIRDGGFAHITHWTRHDGGWVRESVTVCDP